MEAAKFAIDPEFQSLLPQPTKEEYDGLEAQILAGLHIDPVIVLVFNGSRLLGDGHTRHTIATKHGLTCPVREKRVRDRDEAKAWIVANQLARRNLTDERRAYYRGLQYLGAKQEHGGDRKTGGQNPDSSKKVVKNTAFFEKKSSCQNDNLIGKTAAAIAQESGVSPSTIIRDAEFAEAVEATAAVHGPEAKEEILSGESGLSKAEVIRSAPVLCSQCTRNLRVGNPVVKGCKDCKALRKPSLKSAVSEALSEVPEETAPPTIEDEMADKNHELESFCRKLMKLVETELPKDAWLDYMNHRASAIQKFKDGCATIRGAKCSNACPICQGEGCGKCLNTGRVPKYNYQQLCG